jgi:hypothetical protein
MSDVLFMGDAQGCAAELLVSILQEWREPITVGRKDR